MKATVLVDNVASALGAGEWGLCVYIEHDDQHILLDTGASDLFVTNAKKMGFDLNRIDLAVLSHAHFDHANGFPAFLENNTHAPIYIQKGTKDNCYKRLFWVYNWYIGIPKGILERYPTRFKEVDKMCDLGENVRLLGHTTPHLESVGQREKMYLKNGRRWTFDDFAHEQSLIFQTQHGLVIFNSCCHGGADVIIEEAKQAYPNETIYALIGGLHLYEKSEEYVRAFAKRVKETGIQYVYTGHCTKEKAYGILKEELGDIVRPFEVGAVMEF